MNWALSCLLPTVTAPLFVLPTPDLFLRLSPPSMSGSDRLPLELMVIIALLEKKGEFEGFFTNAANGLWGDDFEPWKPRGPLKALAHKRSRFGYRRLHVLLRREGYLVNHKRLFRFYRAKKLTGHKRGGRKRAMGTRAPMLIHLWRSQISGRHMSTNVPSSPQNFSIWARLCVAVNPRHR